jgi:signal transduction histidine kinase
MILTVRLSTGEAFKSYFQSAVKTHLHQYFNYIDAEIGSPPNLETAARLSHELDIIVVIEGPDLLWSSEEYVPNLQKFRFKKHSNQIQTGRGPEGFAIQIQSAPYQTTYIGKDNRESSPPVGRILFGLLFVLGLLYIILRRMIQPLRDIQTSIKRIGSGDLSHRVTIKGKDELGDLAAEINNMADDIESMLEAKRQMLLAISHELRSPITRAKVAVSLMNEDQLKSGLEDDLNEMEVMISGLLEAEKLNHRHQILNLESANFNVVVSDLIDQFFLEENIRSSFNCSEQPVTIDIARIQFVARNLINNALQHRKHVHDEIEVRTYSDAVHFALVINDFGSGVSARHVPHLTEPFYRVDPSRQRETGGYGLGLYIVDKVVKAHQGQLTIESTKGIGTQVTVKMPHRWQ